MVVFKWCVAARLLIGACCRCCCRVPHGAQQNPTWVKASVFDISSEKISEEAIMAKGVSSPRAFAIPIAMAVLPVPG